MFEVSNEQAKARRSWAVFSYLRRCAVHGERLNIVGVLVDKIISTSYESLCSLLPAVVKRVSLALVIHGDFAYCNAKSEGGGLIFCISRTLSPHKNLKKK